MSAAISRRSAPRSTAMCATSRSTTSSASRRAICWSRSRMPTIRPGSRRPRRSFSGRSRDRQPQVAKGGAASPGGRSRRRDCRDTTPMSSAPGTRRRGSASCSPRPSAPRKGRAGDRRSTALRRDARAQPGRAGRAAPPDWRCSTPGIATACRRQGQGGARSIWRRSISAIPGSPRRSPARSASAACATGNTSMPGPR